MSLYEAALNMYHREHDRWYQWALFFFAGVGATFYVAGQCGLPMWLACAAASVISLVWVLAASSIRASTAAWQQTLLHLEAHPDPQERAFETFQNRLDHFDYLGDFRKTLHFWQRTTFLSVSRLLVWSGLLGCGVFIVLAVVGVARIPTGKP